MKYYLPTESTGKILVCKHMFLNTFGISERRAKIVSEKNFSAALCDIKFQHASKSSKAHNKLSDDVIKEVEDFIKRYPTVPTHYTRKDTKNIILNFV